MNIEYFSDNKFIVGTNADDSISSAGHHSTIDARGGNDTVKIGSRAGFSSLSGGAGNDFIDNFLAYNVTLDGGEGNDTLKTMGEVNKMIGGKGDDYVSISSISEEALVIYEEGDGNDLIEGFINDSTLRIDNSRSGYTTQKSGKDIIVSVGEGNITLKGATGLSAVNIVETASNINNTKNNTTLYGTNLGDTIKSTGANVLINGIAGNDSITNSGDSVTIAGEFGNDTIENSGKNVTINAGAGNDLVNNYSAANVLFQYNAGDGNDTITGFREDSTLSVCGGNYTTQRAENDIVVKVGDGSITLKGAANLSTVNITNTPAKNLSNITSNVSLIGTETDDIIQNSGRNVTLSGNEGNDTLINDGQDDKIIGGKGNDSISLGSSSNNALIIFNPGDGNDIIEGFKENSTLQIGDGKSLCTTQKSGRDIIVSTEEGEKITLKGAARLSNLNIVGILPLKVSNNDNYVSIVGTKGDDKIENRGWNVTINTYAGNDFIENLVEGSDVTIDAGEGDDEIRNRTVNVTINGGSGNDTIQSLGKNAKIIGGKGDDHISLEIAGSENALIIYNPDDGNDLVEGFTESSTLSIGGDGANRIYSVTQKSGDDIIVSVSSGGGQVTLKGAAALSNVNIVDTPIEDINFRDYTTLLGTGGNDTIRNKGGDYVTVNAGKGDDIIYLYNDTKGEELLIERDYNDWSPKSNETKREVVIHNDGDGNDTIYGFFIDDTLQIGDGTGGYSTMRSGYDMIVTTGEDQILIKDVYKNVIPDMDYIESYISKERNGWSGYTYHGISTLNINP